jgi:hypothetical protein
MVIVVDYPLKVGIIGRERRRNEALTRLLFCCLRIPSYNAIGGCYLD